MAAGAFGAVLFVLLGLGGGLLLYWLVRAEHDRRRTMSREDAESAARRDSDDE